MCLITAVQSLKRINGNYQVVETTPHDNSKIAATCPCNIKLTIFLNESNILSQNIPTQKDGWIHNETKERKRSAGHGNKTAWEHKI